MANFPTRRALTRLGVVPVLAVSTVAAYTVCESVANVGPAAIAATTQVSVFGDRTPKTSTNSDSAAVELGMRFRSTEGGEVTGVRFFKGSGNTGTHTGSLWSSSGQRLAQATFTGESGSGWQSVSFATPVNVTAGSTYVVSYNAPRGHYAADGGFFNSATNNGPLSALKSGDGGGNGVYRYGSSGFPTNTYNAMNYWVDVNFRQGTAPTTTTTTKPTTTSTAPATTTTKPTTTTTRPTTTTTKATTTTTNPTPPAGSFPSAATTGVPSGTGLTQSGGRTITTAGTVLDALDVNGQITIAASNVTIKRSRFTGTGQTYGVYVQSGSVRIEDSEFSGNYGTAAVAGDSNVTLLRSEISGLPADALKLGSNSLYEGNWIHDMKPGPGAHADGGQVQSGLVNVTVRGNFIDMNKSANAAIFIANNFGPTTNGPILMEGNLWGGGQYTIFVYDGNNGQYFIHNITVRNNHFLRNTANYGPATRNVPVTQGGNVWHDNNEPITF